MGLLTQLSNLLKPQDGISPNHILFTLLEQGRYAHHADDYAEALKIYAEAEKIAKNVRTPSALVDVLIHQSGVYSSMREYRYALQLLDEALFYSKAHSLYTHQIMLHCERGQIAQAQGDTETARTYYEQARDLAKENALSTARPVAHLATIALKEENTVYAVHLFQSSLPYLDKHTDEHLPLFMAQHGQALLYLGNTAEAQKVIDKAIEYGIARKQVHFLRQISFFMGKLAYEKNELQKAKRYLYDAVQLHRFPHIETDQYIASCVYYGLTLIALGQLDSARQQADSIQTCKTSTPIAEALRHTLQGEIAYTTQAWHLAQAQFEQASHSLIDLPLSALSAFVWQRLIQATRHQDLSRAIETAQHALTIAKRTAYAPMLLCLLGEMTHSSTPYQDALLSENAHGSTRYYALIYSKLAHHEAQLGNSARALKYADTATLYLSSADKRSLPEALWTLGDALTPYDLDSAQGFYSQAKQHTH